MEVLDLGAGWNVTSMLTMGVAQSLQNGALYLGSLNLTGEQFATATSMLSCAC